MRKLGVLELDAFFPAADRVAFAVRLNSLLASPGFATWMAGDPIDIESMLRTPDGAPRCAIITTAHLSDEQRQSVTALVLAKLVTWMRRQGGTSDLRALLYMDEVAGYLPPTANPPTKKPIMLLLKQARAFGLGVVLSTQNPVDVDYKALSNAGTWLIGRLQTEQDKARLIDGLKNAAGSVDISAVSETISTLGKRQFMLKRVGSDQPSLTTTRWAMSYLRGPLMRSEITRLAESGLVARAAALAATTQAPAPQRVTRRHGPCQRRCAGRRVTGRIGPCHPRRRRDPGRPEGGDRHRRVLPRSRRPLGRDDRIGGGHPAACGGHRPRATAVRRHQGRPDPRRGVRGGAVPASLGAQPH